MFDAVVIGRGIVGAQAALHMARLGLHVTSVDGQQTADTHNASSGGDTRIFRSFSPGNSLEALSYCREHWQELDLRSPHLFLPSGSLIVADQHDPRLPEWANLGTLAGADILEGRHAAERWPTLNLSDGDLVVHDRRGGVLRARGGVRASVEAAQSAGAKILHATVLGVRRSSGRLHIETTAGNLVTRFLAFCMGSDPGSLGRDFTSSAPTIARRVLLGWDGAVHDAADTAFPPGMKFVAQAGSVSFFPAVNKWGRKFNHIPPQRPQVSRYDAHPIFSGSDVDELHSAARKAVRGVTGLARVESFVESYEGGDSLWSTSSSGWGVIGVQGLSGNGYRLAPWLGDRIAQKALSTLVRG